MTNAQSQRKLRYKNRILSESKNIFSRLSTIYSASRSQYQQLLRHAGDLSVVEWRTLWDLHEVGTLSVAELAQLQHADHSQVSRSLPAMRSKGWITMRRSTEDGRQTVIELTQLGEEVFARAAPILQRRRQRVRELFTESEMEQLFSLLDRFETELRAPIDNLLEEVEAHA